MVGGRWVGVWRVAGRRPAAGGSEPADRVQLHMRVDYGPL